MAITKSELNAKLDALLKQVAAVGQEHRDAIASLQIKLEADDAIMTEDYTEELDKLNQIANALEAIVPDTHTTVVEPLQDSEVLSKGEVEDLQKAAGAEAVVATNDDTVTPITEATVVNPEQAGEIKLGVDLGKSEPAAAETAASVLPTQTSVLVDDSAVSEQAKPPDQPVKLEETPSPLTQTLSVGESGAVAPGEEPRAAALITDNTPVSRAQSEPETVEVTDGSEVTPLRDVIKEGGSETPDGIPLIK